MADLANKTTVNNEANKILAANKTNLINEAVEIEVDEVDKANEANEAIAANNTDKADMAIVAVETNELDDLYEADEVLREFKECVCKRMISFKKISLEDKMLLLALQEEIMPWGVRYGNGDGEKIGHKKQ